MTDLDRAIADSLHALNFHPHPEAEATAIEAEYRRCLHNIIAALDAARGEAVGETAIDEVNGADGPYRFIYAKFKGDANLPPGTKLFAAPPAARSDACRVEPSGCWHKANGSPAFHEECAKGGCSRLAPPAALADGEALIALRALHDVVIRQNRLGAKWHAELFSDLMAALVLSRRAIEGKPIPPAAAVPEGYALVRKWREQAKGTLRWGGPYGGNDMADRIDDMADELEAMLAAAERKGES